MDKTEVFTRLGLTAMNSGVYAGAWLPGAGREIESINPTSGEVLATVRRAAAEEYEQVVQTSTAAFAGWRMLPAPRRGEYIRLLGNALREHKEPLAALVSMEMGKILPEG